LLSQEPGLVKARSQREHGATLLHYVAANGVEDERQKTPANIIEVTEVLLRAGAEVNATAKMYGGNATTLGSVATSAHPERAGVQEALLETLMRHGADYDASAVVAALANGRLQAAEFLASRCDSLGFIAAAGVGRLDVVEAYMHSGVSAEELKQGFLYACAAGRKAVVEFLLANGADVGMQDRNGQTGLHWAAIGAHLESVKLLLKHNALLEVKNVYGGTVLGQTLWSAERSDNPAGYRAVADALVAAGAELQ
jgi:ankyrin repeat protein